MPFQEFTNNAFSTLSVAVSSNTQASLTDQTGHGARYPSPNAPDYFLVTLDDGTNIEICKCIAISGDVLTVLRGQEGTTAQASDYASIFAADLRRCNAKQLPVPEPKEAPEMPGGDEE